jgi:hypothetical protein
MNQIRILKKSSVLCNSCMDVLTYKPFTDGEIFCKCCKVSITKNSINYMNENDFTEHCEYDYISKDEYIQRMKR